MHFPYSIPSEVSNIIESPKPIVEMNDFEQLVLRIKETLGPSSGLTSEDVDVEDLTLLMERYNSKEGEWAEYAMADPCMAYTRNLVDEGNGKANLVSRLILSSADLSR